MSHRGLKSDMKKKFIIIVFFLIFFVSLIANANNGVFSKVLQSAKQHNAVEGIWLGKITFGDINLRVVLNISTAEDGTLNGTMDSVDQLAKDIPIEEIHFENNMLHLEFPSIKAVYDGKLSEDGTHIDGKWIQSGYEAYVIFNKIESESDIPEVKRPQTPKKPYPYKEEEVFFENKKAGIVISGTLTLPSSSGGPFPAVILIAGSGPNDRDETVFGHKPFLVLADYLTRHGIAVLRYDKRGIGKSKGNYAAATTVDFSDDTLAGVNYLLSRKDIDHKNIGLIGHSEGGLIAPIAASKSKDIAFIVLMAAPGLKGEDILYFQGSLIIKADGGTDEEVSRNLALQKEIFSIIKSGKDPQASKEKLYKIIEEQITIREKITDKDKLKKIVKEKVKMLFSPWLKFFLEYDPSTALKKVACPVLVLNGDKDLQVPVEENLKIIEEAFKASGNKDYTIKKLPGLNHLFQTCKTGSPSEYVKIEETISPSVIDIIKNWIVKEVAKNK